MYRIKDAGLKGEYVTTTANSKQLILSGGAKRISYHDDWLAGSLIFEPTTLPRLRHLDVCISTTASESAFRVLPVRLNLVHSPFLLHLHLYGVL